MYGNFIQSKLARFNLQDLTCFDKPQHLMYGNNLYVSMSIILFKDKPQHLMYGNGGVFFIGTQIASRDKPQHLMYGNLWRRARCPRTIVNDKPQHLMYGNCKLAMPFASSSA